MNPFTTDGTHRAASDPLTLTVPELLAYLTPHTGGEAAVTLRAAADGYLIAHADGAGDAKPVVTAWTGEGQGKSHGRPERWRQNYYREFAHETAAESRFVDLVAKHGGPAEGGDR